MSQADRFMRACRREPVDATPIWLMRQAGRNIPAYLELHNKYGFLNLCQNAEMAAKITLMPYEHYGVDACVLFSDMPLAVTSAMVRAGVVTGSPFRLVTSAGSRRFVCWRRPRRRRDAVRGTITCVAA